MEQPVVGGEMELEAGMARKRIKGEADRQLQVRCRSRFHKSGD